MTLRQNEFELSKRDSSETDESFNIDDADFETQALTSNSYNNQQPSSLLRRLLALLPHRVANFLSGQRIWRRHRRRSGHSLLGCPIILGRRTRLVFNSFAGIITALLIVTAIFRPSYTNPPVHYEKLRQRILANDDYGRGNIDNQKIFIAASLYDKGGKLVKGAWGRNVLELMDILGNRNTFLSIYENDSGEEAEKALKDFEGKVQCNSQLVYDEHMPLGGIPKITLPDGTERIKRIAYLAEVRNKAMQPLKDSEIMYDKVLFLNDVIFDPIDAAQLLFSTNTNEHGRSSYHAACAVDFINPFKFYDTFATRDLEGYSMGVPFFPWFSDAGEGLSRQDVLDGKDAVRVKSCWGGMVAFDASFLQAPISGSATGKTEKRNILPANDEEPVSEVNGWNSSHPIRFRAEPDLDWDASECCLIHADLIQATLNQNVSEDTGIYQNPFVRVAYGTKTLWFLPFTRRFERLYTVPHNIIDYLVGLPWPNPRRKATKNNEGADGGGYCGMRTLQLLREDPKNGESNWETVPVPSG